MIRKFASLFAVITLCASFALVAPLPSAHAADVLNGVDCSGVARKSAVCQDKTNTNPVSGNHGLLLKIIRLVGMIAGVAAVIMIIIGGFQYLVSSGDATKAASARNTLIFAVIGLLVVILAASILSFVINKIG